MATLPMVPLSVIGVWLESPRAQACIRAGYAHDLMHVTVSNVCGFRWQASGHISSEGSGWDCLLAWLGARFNWLQLVSCCGGLCVARTRRPISTSLVRVQHALVEVHVCVAPEPLGLGEGSSNACLMLVACTVVGPVAVGCSWARYTVIYGRTILFRFLDMFLD